MTDLVRYEKDGPVATVVLNRPDKLNAINWDMVNQLNAAWDRAAAEDDVNCVVLTGEGRAFSVGDDLNQAWTGDQFETLMQRFRERPGEPESIVPFEFAKPVIAAINGYCFAGALELALWADILIASETAVFAANFIEHGLTGGATTYFRLPRLMGPSSAALLLLTGQRIDAHEAARLGLVSLVVGSDRLLDTANELAHKIGGYSPRAVASIKAGLRLSIGGRLQDQGELIAHANGALAEVFGSLRR